MDERLPFILRSPPDQRHRHVLSRPCEFPAVQVQKRNSCCALVQPIFRRSDGSAIEPICCQTHILERVVNRVQNAVGANLEHDLRKGLCSEIATRSYVEVLPEIVTESGVSLSDGLVVS